jgi:beta-lactamase class A
MKYSSQILISFLSLFFISCSADKDIDELAGNVQAYLQNEEGTFAVWFQHLENPELQFAINPDTVFHAASTMKTPVMIELFRRAELGEFDLSDSIRIENQFYSIVDGSEFQLELNPEGDDPYEAMEGEMATLYDLNHAMITYSSNIATNIIIQLVGAEETTQTMRKLGASNIDVLRGVYDMKAFDLGLSNMTTARDLAILFEHLANGTAVNPEADSIMIEVLKDQFYRDVIPAKLPNDLEIANKTGFITGVRHDSAIVYLPDGSSYILIYLSKNLPDGDRGTEIGTEISRMIYEFVTAD